MKNPQNYTRFYVWSNVTYPGLFMQLIDHSEYYVPETVESVQDWYQESFN